MKLTNLRFVRKGTKLTLLGTALDKFRKPAKLTISFDSIEDPVGPEEHQIVTGDATTVGKVLAALAESAWANGWRPVGLEQEIAKTIALHGRK